MNDKQPQKSSKKSTFWMIYVSLIVAAFVLIGDGISALYIERWSVKVGIAMLFTTFFLLVCRSLTKAIIASVIICIAVVATFLY
ncbi:MAG: hypothetical protein U9N55_08930 [candidate division Zixibacteria bacterium]|nr:hypothetical protein [candidate division Zixibacteria bacterium]